MSDKAFYHHILSDNKLLNNLARRAREEMYGIFLQETSPTAQSAILDVGVSVTENERLEENILEKRYQYPDRITMLGIHEGAFLEKLYPGTTYVRYDGISTFPFSDNQFDICYCNAVLEHVGDERNQKEFIREILRVCRKVFLTTPNRAYPIDFHKMMPFLHWLPMDWYRGIILLMGDTFYSKKENLNLLYKNDLRRLFQTEGIPFQIHTYKWFGLPAYLIVVAG